MAKELNPALKSAVEKVKSLSDVDKKSTEEIFNRLKTEICNALEISENKWKELNRVKIVSFNIDDMSATNSSLDDSVKKLANNIKKKKQEEKENSEENKEKSEDKKFEIKLIFNNSFKNKIVNMPKIQALQTIKNEIIRQASSQNISVEMLSQPCSSIKKGFSFNQVNLPDNSKFLDAISEYEYLTFMGLDPMNKDNYNKPENDQEKENRPQYENKSSIEELMDTMTGKNTTDIKKDKNKAMIESEPTGPSM